MSAFVPLQLSLVLTDEVEIEGRGVGGGEFTVTPTDILTIPVIAGKKVEARGGFSLEPLTSF